MPEVRIVEREKQAVLELEIITRMQQMAKRMETGFLELLEVLEANGLCMTEAPYARYIGIDWKTQMRRDRLGNLLDMFFKKWHLRVGVHLTEEILPSGEFLRGKLENTKYLELTHIGPYQKSTESYKKIWEFAQANNLQLLDEASEYYLNNPRVTPPEQLETRIMVPVAELEQ
jgi:effector-binding domain-containing protein